MRNKQKSRRKQKVIHKIIRPLDIDDIQIIRNSIERANTMFELLPICSDDIKKDPYWHVRLLALYDCGMGYLSEAIAALNLILHLHGKKSRRPEPEKTPAKTH